MSSPKLTAKSPTKSPMSSSLAASITPPQRIVVFRALQLGDMLCAVPALRALRHAWPDARISLIGLPWAREFVARYSAYLDEFIEFPGFPLFPERDADLAKLSVFLKAMQARQFNLAIQMHGDGRVSNSMVAAFGADQRAGFHHPTRRSPNPDTFIPWPEALSEVHTLLSLATHLGAPWCGDHLEFPIRLNERAEFCILQDAFAEQPYICIHPGARLETRRWRPERFARVADELAADGYAVVLTGTQSESELCAAVAAAMRTRPINLCGRTSLGTLACLVEQAALVVCNDTGMSHIAAALRTPSVVACCGADPTRWRPQDTERHRVLWIPVPCRPCFSNECPSGHECATGLPSSAVLKEARQLLDSMGKVACSAFSSSDADTVQ